MFTSQRQLVRLYMDREWWLIVLVLALGRRMQTDVCEFELSTVDMASSGLHSEHPLCTHSSPHRLHHTTRDQYPWWHTLLAGTHPEASTSQNSAIHHLGAEHSNCKSIQDTSNSNHFRLFLNTRYHVLSSHPDPHYNPTLNYEPGCALRNSRWRYSVALWLIYDGERFLRKARISKTYERDKIKITTQTQQAKLQRTSDLVMWHSGELAVWCVWARSGDTQWGLWRPE